MSGHYQLFNFIVGIGEKSIFKPYNVPGPIDKEWLIWNVVSQWRNCLTTIIIKMILWSDELL